MKHSLTTVGRLIAGAFDDEELHAFCQNHFEEAIDYFAPEMGKRTKVRILVEYCDRREELDELLEKVKAERPKKYEKFKAQLESGEGVPSVVEEIRAGASEYAEVFESIGSAEPRHKHVSTEADSMQETIHPLAGSQQEIKHWFLEELDFDEQVFVMTAALFSGLERQELMDIYREALHILQPVEAQTDEGAQHG